MTAQVHELLIIEGEKTSMPFCPPLPENHPDIKALTKDETEKDDNIPWVIFSTACWRQYIGTWELKDGKLYLVDIRGRYKKISETPIFADWVTTVLRVTSGELLEYVHMGFASVYEFENHIKIENGIVLEERRVDNRNKDIDGRDLGSENLPGNENNFDGDDF